MLHSIQSIGALSSGSRQLNLTRSFHPEASGRHGNMLFTPKLHSHSQGIILSCFSNSSMQTKAGVSDEPLEAESSLSLSSSLRTSEKSPDSKEIEKLQYKVCELQKNGQEAAGPPGLPCFLSSPFRAVRGGDTTWQSLSKNGAVLSSTSSPTISMPVDSDSTQAPHPWQSSRSCNSSCVKELIEDGRMHNPGALKRKLSSGSASTGKTSTNTHHQERDYDNRPGASKKGIFTSNKDVDIFMTVAEIEDPSDEEEEEEEEGGHGVSEKRRKRMLSNRASAQRSRQRRQERLETLEILVAELRVKNAALTRRAESAATAAEKLVEENSLLRDRLRIVLFSDSNASHESDKTTENSNMLVHNKTESSCRPDTRVGSCIYTEESLSRASSGALKDKRDDKPLESSRHWSIINSGTNFDSDLMDNSTYLEISGTVLPDNARGLDVKDLCQSAIMSMAQKNSLQSRNQFGIDIGQCNLEMDSTELYSRYVEDILEESLANCVQ